ncbi:MAG: transketolase [Chloroflexi bacterium]|jgi:transketolase|nr:transketolase [Chloroflexota bacterium]MBT7082378.1 transketolase [Chloroflexota bacterium]MBT7290618.1 transketolase [Chloroflexota bacterium]
MSLSKNDWTSNLNTSGNAEVFSLSDAQLLDKAKTIRRHIVSMVSKAASGHPGGSLSAVEIVTALYFRLLRHDPKNPRWSERDRFILSKGHAAPVLYAALAECGYIPVDELSTLRQLDSRLQGHTDMTTVPGVEMSAGSLGQGLSFSVGVALASRLDKKDIWVYTLMGDGECDEGQVWEAAMAAAHHKLDRMIAFVDYNKLQIDGWNKDVMNLEPFTDKWSAFGWHIIEIDGNDMGQVLNAIESAKKIEGKPKMIIAHTVKGKGVSFMENNVDFHGQAPNAEQTQIALEELK